MKEAQEYVKEKRKSTATCLMFDRPWTEETDDLFFSKRKRGLASWYLPSGSSIYYEFEGN
jgi:hypothetical protein